jgi:hypothetical protein
MTLAILAACLTALSIGISYYLTNRSHWRKLILVIGGIGIALSMLQAYLSRQRTTTLETQIAEAKALAKARRLSSQSAATMFSAARQFCPQIKRIPVTAANGNQEAQAYASDFVKVFRDAGCESDLQLPIPGLTPDVQDLFIGVRTLTAIPSEVGLIDKVLMAGEIKYEVRPLTPDFFPNEPFVFIVGAKPPPMSGQ